MEKKQLCCGYLQAMKLKELGLKQESCFSYFGDPQIRVMDNGNLPATIGAWIFIATTDAVNNMELDHRKDCFISDPLASAYTFSELSAVFDDDLLHSIESYWFPTLSATDLSEIIIKALEYGTVSVTDLNKRVS